MDRHFPDPTAVAAHPFGDNQPRLRPAAVSKLPAPSTTGADRMPLSGRGDGPESNARTGDRLTIRSVAGKRACCRRGIQ